MNLQIPDPGLGCGEMAQVGWVSERALQPLPDDTHASGREGAGRVWPQATSRVQFHDICPRGNLLPY